MQIKEVQEKLKISSYTLRYYERVGLIPAVSRTSGGIRNYDDEALGWVENAICMRSAGVPIEALIEYVKLFQEGDSTIQARLELLQEQLAGLEEQKVHIESTMKRLNYKISCYEKAVKTGKLVWDNCEEK